VFAFITENLGHEIRGAIDDFRVILEISCCIDKATKLYNALDALQIAITSREYLGDYINPAQSGGLITIFEGEVVTDSADIL
jgi:hypothetical protein